jgi:long-chain acyl-CoA synthetase
MLTHGNVVVNAKHAIIAFQHRTSDRYLHAGPMFHLADGSQTYGLTWVGATHVIIPSFDAEAVVRSIEEHRITLALLVPTMINMVVNHPSVAEHDLSSLERLVYGASPMPEELQRRAMQVLRCGWMQGYGMTEAAPLVSTSTPEDHERGLKGEEPYATRLRSAGAPVVGVQAEVRRADGTLADVGEAGEIWVKGPNVMVGYWKRTEETAAALTPDGWYRSGDVAWADADGYLYVVDRAKDMIISGGENVYSTEVENALYRHPAVLEAAVIGVPDERWGERIHAVVVLRPDSTVDPDELVAHCRPLIAGYKLPRSIDVRTEPLPKSGAGKILKRELREPFWSGADRRVH